MGRYRTRPDTDELIEVIEEEILYGLDIDPADSDRIRTYLQERDKYFFGPFALYFLLGSYESPFKYRLDDALDILNHRPGIYAYLLATQPDLDISDDLPHLKVKFYLHACYADVIPLVLEHNTGGALTEFGRLERPEFLERTYVFPRAHMKHYLDAEATQLTPVDYIQACAVELAYKSQDLDTELEELASIADEHDLSITKADLEQYLQDELNGRNPTYSGVLSDGFVHFEGLEQCFSWTRTSDLESLFMSVNVMSAAHTDDGTTAADDPPVIVPSVTEPPPYHYHASKSGFYTECNQDLNPHHATEITQSDAHHLGYEPCPDCFS